MYLTLIILPLLGSIFSGFFGRKIGVTGSQLITCTCVVLTTILAITCFFEVGLNNLSVHIKLLRWIDSESLNVSWGFLFDSLTVSMLIPVLIVSSLVHIYSIGYMSHDPHNQRFFSYLSLFTFMMIILVTADNYLLMFVGWEGVGVCSYLLVSFWFTRIPANQSSLSAFLTNRVGDWFLTVGMFAMIWAVGNLEYSTVFSVAPYMSNSVITLIGVCLLIGAMAKSSQIGLHVWLPMAMEGWSRAFLKFHYMRRNLITKWSTFYFVNIGKIHYCRQCAGNIWNLFSMCFFFFSEYFTNILKKRPHTLNFSTKNTSETRREIITIDDMFKWWLIGLTFFLLIFMQ